MNLAPVRPTTAEAVLADVTSSSWIRSALISAMERDPIDALNDALVLAAALESRLRTQLALETYP